MEPAFFMQFRLVLNSGSDTIVEHFLVIGISVINYNFTPLTKKYKK